MPPSQFVRTINTVYDSGGFDSVEFTEATRLANGNYVLGWQLFAFSAGAVRGSRLMLFDADGNHVRTISLVGGWGLEPSVASTADGGFVAVWSVRASIAGMVREGDVFIQRFAADGTSLAPAERVNPVADVGSNNIDVAQLQAEVTVLGSGRILVVWTDGDTALDVRMQLYDPGGVKIGGDVLATASGTDNQRNPSLMTLSDGGAVLVWEDNGGTGGASDHTLMGRRFDSDGVAGATFTINTVTAESQTGASVAALASGFVVVWQSGSDIKGQRFDLAGAKLGAEFDVASDTTGTESNAHVAAYPGGGFVVLWDDDGAHRVRLFDEDGTPVSEFAVDVGDVPNMLVRTDGGLEFVSEGQFTQLVVGMRTDRYEVAGPVGDIGGTFGNDTIWGDTLANTLSGLGGSDVLNGGDGDDVLIGGVGFDQLRGDGGVDTADYGGSPGAVNVNLALNQGFSNDAQSDTYSSVENVTGSAFADFLTGDGGANRLDGAGGDDSLEGRLGADALIGGAGIDTATFHDSIGTVFVNLTLGQGFNNSAHGDSYDGIENVTGSAHNDVLIGTEGVNRLDGGNGNDILVGALGADVLVGGAGLDTVNYQDAIGSVFVNMTLGQGFNNSAHGDTYDGIESVTGSAHNDFLIGDSAGNSLDGWNGDDILVGAGGGDALIGGNGIDTASYEEAAASVFVNLNIGQGFGNNAQGDTYSGIENVNGTSLADVIIGEGGVNVLNGGAGDDLLVGSVGADVLNGGADSDTASYEDNWGAVFINLGTGQGFGNAAEGDTYTGIENVNGSVFNDGLLGNDGANRLNGGFGNDLLVGHGGADQFLFDSALSAAANLDTIADFAPGVDKILLDNAVFAGLPEGALGPNAFIAAPAATGGSNRIVYDQATGALYYDPDGFGSDPAIQFATLTNRPTLTGADFLVI